MKIRHIASGFTAGMLLLLALPLSIVAGNSTDGSFTIALVISNIEVDNIGLTEANVFWETNGNATSQVYYDTESHNNIESYRYRTILDASAVLNHSVHLTGLFEGTTYHCRVRSVAMVGPDEHVAVSDNFSFTTLQSTTTVTTTTSVITTTTSGVTTETTTLITTTMTLPVTTTETATTSPTTTASSTPTATTSPVITDTTTSPQTTTGTTSAVITDTTPATTTIATLTTIGTTTPSSGITNLTAFYWTVGTAGGIGLSAALLLLFIRRRKKKDSE